MPSNALGMSIMQVVSVQVRHRSLKEQWWAKLRGGWKMNEKLQRLKQKKTVKEKMENL